MNLRNLSLTLILLLVGILTTNAKTKKTNQYSFVPKDAMYVATIDNIDLLEKIYKSDKNFKKQMKNSYEMITSEKGWCFGRNLKSYFKDMGINVSENVLLYGYMKDDSYYMGTSFELKNKDKFKNLIDISMERLDYEKDRDYFIETAELNGSLVNVISFNKSDYPIIAYTEDAACFFFSYRHRSALSVSDEFASILKQKESIEDNISYNRVLEEKFDWNVYVNYDKFIDEIQNNYSLVNYFSPYLLDTLLNKYDGVTSFANVNFDKKSISIDGANVKNGVLITNVLYGDLSKRLNPDILKLVSDEIPITFTMSLDLNDIMIHYLHDIIHETLFAGNEIYEEGFSSMYDDSTSDQDAEEEEEIEELTITKAILDELIYNLNGSYVSGMDNNNDLYLAFDLKDSKKLIELLNKAEKFDGVSWDDDSKCYVMDFGDKFYLSVKDNIVLISESLSQVAAQHGNLSDFKTATDKELITNILNHWLYSEVDLVKIAESNETYLPMDNFVKSFNKITYKNVGDKRVQLDIHVTKGNKSSADAIINLINAF